MADGTRLGSISSPQAYCGVARSNGQRFVISIFNLRHDGNGAPKRLLGGIVGALNIDAPETS